MGRQKHTGSTASDDGPVTCKEMEILLSSWKGDIMKDLNEKIDKLVTKENVSEVVKSSLSDITRGLALVEVKQQQQESMIKVMKMEHQKLKNRIINNECRSMSQNFIIKGLPEEDGENLEDSIIDLLTDVLQIPEDNVEVLVCHRLRPAPKTFGQKERPRNIVVKLGDKNQVFEVMKSAKHLKDHTPVLHIEQQYPAEISENRRALLPVMKYAKSIGHKAFLRRDSLIIDSKSFRTETIEDVPFSLEEMHMKQNATSVAFLGQFCFLSNFHRAEFSVNGQQFINNEQFIHHSKAIAAKDLNQAAQILLEEDPFTIKQLGGVIPKPAGWDALSAAKTGAMAKFQQNPGLKLKLLDTGKKLIAEASLSSFWGVAKSLRDSDILNPKSWKKGKNHMGHILQDIRKELS